MNQMEMIYILMAPTSNKVERMSHVLERAILKLCHDAAPLGPSPTSYSERVIVAFFPKFSLT